jgi:hypothetical protein
MARLIVQASNMIYPRSIAPAVEREEVISKKSSDKSRFLSVLRLDVIVDRCLNYDAGVSRPAEVTEGSALE